MKVTEIRVIPVVNQKPLLAYCTLVFDDCFAVHDVRLLEGKKGRYISMPSKKGKNGMYRNMAHPTQPAFRLHLLELILAAFEPAKTTTSGSRDSGDSRG